MASEIEARRQWDLVYGDEDLGMFTVVCRSRFPRGADDLTIWVRLDENGLTRLEAESAHREGKTSSGTRQRRVEDLLAAVREAVGPDRLVRREADR